MDVGPFYCSSRNEMNAISAVQEVWCGCGILYIMTYNGCFASCFIPTAVIQIITALLLKFNLDNPIAGQFPCLGSGYLNWFRILELRRFHGVPHFRLPVP